MRILDKYSFGVGDRFGKQAKAQLRAIMQANREGIPVVPVWNKSYREHTIIKSTPQAVRRAADEAVQALGYRGAYFVDADHIGLETVDSFIEWSDFFTLDVADFIGSGASAEEVQKFRNRFADYIGEIEIPGFEHPLIASPQEVERIAHKFLPAVQAAGRVYRIIEKAKGRENFVTEISMDETDQPQSPMELFFILAAIAAEGIPVQTIAPKFTGRFNKGVDYVGEVSQFAAEFEQDLLVLQFAIAEFDLPPNLKLSVHSGSDKFSLYPEINRLIKKHDAGLHLKTAGTTWLEELIGLAEAGGEGLEIAKRIYQEAYHRFEELCKPYAAVVDIDPSHLPRPETVENWNGETYTATLRHEPTHEAYNPHFRQLLHLSYKLAAEMGERYLNALDTCEAVVAENVTRNILERHIRPIFG
ncbi:MAG: tagaturonate epimerase family protein [Calditrichia bacterium]